MLFAVPIPEEYSIDPDIINKVIDESLKNMPGVIEGKNITPYLLAEVSKITGGKSLESSILLHLVTMNFCCTASHVSAVT